MNLIQSIKNAIADFSWWVYSTSASLAFIAIVAATLLIVFHFYVGEKP
jgi:hypothetical protein